MPNHVVNEIVLHGAKLDDVRRHLFNTEGRLSFEVLLPLPLNFWAGDVGREHEQAFPGTQMNAAREVWGTKWDAYGDPKAEDGETGVTILFQSAWNHPRGWVCALFNAVKCDMTVSWLSEGGAAAHVEKYSAEGRWGSPTWDDEALEDGSAEHRRLHKLLWGVEEFSEEDEG